MLAHLVAAELFRCSGKVESCQPFLVEQSCKLLSSIMDSEVPVILKAVCEALRICLPPLLSSSHASLGTDLLHQLMALHKSSYWLLKVELLQTLAVLDYAYLSLLDNTLPSHVLNDVALPLLGDTNPRVQSAVAAALAVLVAKVDLHHAPLHYSAQSHAQKMFVHLKTGPVQISLAGIGNVGTKWIPSAPYSLEHVVWRCYSLLGASGDQCAQRGALEVLCCLAEQYPPPTLPSLWGCSGSSCGLLEMVLQLIRGVCVCVCVYVCVCMWIPILLVCSRLMACMAGTHPHRAAETH